MHGWRVALLSGQPIPMFSLAQISCRLSSDSDFPYGRSMSEYGRFAVSSHQRPPVPQEVCVGKIGSLATPPVGVGSVTTRFEQRRETRGGSSVTKISSAPVPHFCFHMPAAYC